MNEIVARIGTDVGRSSWIVIDQAQIDTFADVTGDRQFIHVDAEAAGGTQFGGTIAHGFLMLSLLSRMAGEAMLHPHGLKMVVNYGFDRVRFLMPVGPGKRVRGRFHLAAVEQKNAGEWRFVHSVTVEIEDETKPALIADWIGLMYI